MNRKPSPNTSTQWRRYGRRAVVFPPRTIPIYVQNASLCLDAIFKHILNCSVRHRHHRSWFGARNSSAYISLHHPACTGTRKLHLVGWMSNNPWLDAFSHLIHSRWMLGEPTNSYKILLAQGFTR
ncbi:hypothetical protein BDV12DRAFT_171195 [Aspergillus spectabilis]